MRLEASFETLVLALREVVGLIDRSGRLWWANRALARLLGVPAGRLAEPLGPAVWLRDRSLAPLMRAFVAVETGLTPPGERVSVQIEIRTGGGWETLVGGLAPLVEGDLDRTALIARPLDRQTDSQGLLPAQIDFLATISHELRSPLISILGYSELLSRDEGRLDLDERREYAADILDSGKHLLGLIEDVLEFAKARRGRMSLRVEDVDLDEVLRHALQLARGQAADRDLHISLSSQGSLGLAQTDRRLLDQVLANLVSNAVKFTPDGGRIELAARLTRPSVQIAVRDTGVGIEEAHLTHLFSPFYQADSGSRRKHGGVGLGLALVRTFMELLGGGVRVRSQPGLGSTFLFWFPRDVRERRMTEPLTDLEGMDRLSAEMPAVDGAGRPGDLLRTTPGNLSPRMPLAVIPEPPKPDER